MEGIPVHAHAICGRYRIQISHPPALCNSTEPRSTGWYGRGTRAIPKHITICRTRANMLTILRSPPSWFQDTKDFGNASEAGPGTGVFQSNHPIYIFGCIHIILGVFPMMVTSGDVTEHAYSSQGDLGPCSYLTPSKGEVSCRIYLPPQWAQQLQPPFWDICSQLICLT